jgi:protein-disulfide isomerase
MEEITIKVNKTTLFTATGLALGLVGGFFLGAWKGGTVGVFAKNTGNEQVIQQQPTVQQPQQQQPNPVVKVSIAKDDHVTGAKSPKIYLVEYSDFQCPYCQSHHNTLAQVMKDYGSKVALVYRHYPLSFHQNADIAANASECASEQGKFWQYHDVLFTKGQGDGTGLGQADLEQYAKNLGLNFSKFQSCLASKKYSTRISNDITVGNSLGVQGTPATFIVDKDGNGELISGAVPYETFKAAIEAKL